MFVLSCAQVQRLLRRGQLVDGGSLLDIGAGDGHVTASLASLVDQVTTTEVSAPMVAHLNTRGYNSVQTCDLQHEFVQSRKPYNIIRYAKRQLCDVVILCLRAYIVGDV